MREDHVQQETFASAFSANSCANQRMRTLTLVLCEMLYLPPIRQRLNLKKITENFLTTILINLQKKALLKTLSSFTP